MEEDYELVDRAKTIAAAGSGGSAQYRALETPGTIKFGVSTFGNTGELRDDDGNPLVAQACYLSWLKEPDPTHLGSHIWTDSGGVRCYCPGPDEG